MTGWRAPRYTLVLAALVASAACPRASSPRPRQAPTHDSRLAAAPQQKPLANGALTTPPSETEAAALRETAPPRPAPPEPARPVELVTIKLVVTPPKLAHVFWGVKDLGVAPLELHRPRGSGPMDIVLRAPGFLTHHTRLFTDRDDALSIALAPENQGARYFGYQAPAEKPASASSARPGAKLAR